MCWFWILQWLLVFITNSADSGLYSYYRYMLPLIIGPLNECILPLIIYWGWFWTIQWILVTITNSADSGPYITIMNDYSVPLNTMCADCRLFNDYKLPLCSISNSALLELCSDPWTTVLLITLIIILLWSFFLLPMETVNMSVRDLLTVFVLYLEILTLHALIFFTSVSCVHFKRYSTWKLANIIVPYSHCVAYHALWNLIFLYYVKIIICLRKKNLKKKDWLIF